MANERKHKKALVSALLAAVVFAGSYYVYDKGWLPGIGGNGANSEKLIAQIEKLEGKNIESAIYELVAGNSVIARLPEREQKDFRESVKKSLEDDVDIIFTFSSIQPYEGGRKGAVKIVEPKLSVIATDPEKKDKDYDITLPALIIAQDAGDDGHYYYTAEGEIGFLTDILKKGEKIKTFAIKYEKLDAEVKFDDGYTAMQKLKGTNVDLVEGRSGTMLLAAKSINSETEQEQEDGKVIIKSKAFYEQITPGDMIKLFIGNIDPLDVKVDYVSEEYLDKSDVKQHDLVKVNEFSVTSGDAGVEANAKLQYSHDEKQHSPQGDVYLKFSNYPKVLTFLRKYYPLRNEDMRAVSKFLMETGSDEGEDASFDLKFDQQGKLLINGKTEEEFKEIYNRHFPQTNEQILETTPVEKIPTIEKKKL